MDSSFEILLIERLTSLEKKIDDVRTKDLPSVKTDVAVLISENKAASKLHSTIGSVMAIFISALFSHFHVK